MTCLLFLFLLQSSRDTWYEYYAAGRLAFAEKDYKQTIANLEAAIAARPESKERVKTYGVQFIEYYPYHMLAQAYHFTGQSEQARISLDKAFSYGEDRDARIGPLLEFMKTLTSGHGKPPVTTASTSRMSEFLDLLASGRYEEAQARLGELFPGEANAAQQQTFGNLLKQMISNRNELNQLQRNYAAIINDLLVRARKSEKSGSYVDALSQYLAVLSIQPQQMEAQQANRRIRDLLAAQGKSEEEIENNLASTSLQLSQRERELLDISKKNKDLEAANQQLIHSLTHLQDGEKVKPEIRVLWSFVPNSDRKLQATFSAKITSNLAIKHIELLENMKPIGQWELKQAFEFELPLYQDYVFQRPSNTLMLRMTDSLGTVIEDAYPYTFAPLAKTLNFKPWVIKTLPIVAVVFAVIYFVYRLRKVRSAFLNRFNPYIAGAPVLNETMFFGRKNLLRQILNTLHNNSLMVYGERRIGKTSFLHQLLHVLPDIEDPEYSFVPVFIDLQGVKEEHFFTLLDHEIGTVLEGLGHVPLERVPGELSGRAFTQRIRAHIQFLKNHMEKNPKLVLLLDEVDVMNGFSEETNQQLRSVFMKGFAKHLVAVMAGIHINTTWKSEGSPWYNFFEQLELKPFDKEQAEELVTDPVRGVYKYQPDAVAHILELTQGKPYLIQKICVNLVALVLNEHRRIISKKDVERVFKEIKTELWAAETPSATPSPPVVG